MINFDVGESLRTILKERQMTQTSLAKLMGRHPSWISNVANKRGASAKTIDELCTALGFSDPGKFISYRAD